MPALKLVLRGSTAKGRAGCDFGLQHGVLRHSHQGHLLNGRDIPPVYLVRALNMSEMPKLIEEGLASDNVVAIEAASVKPQVYRRVSHA